MSGLSHREVVFSCGDECRGRIERSLIEDGVDCYREEDRKGLEEGGVVG